MLPRAFIIVITSIVVLVAGLSYWQLANYDGTRRVSEVVIDAGPDQVWEYLVDPEKRADWVTGLVRIVPLDGTPGTTGSHSMLIMVHEGNQFKVEEEIFGAEPGAWLGLKTVSAGSSLTTTFTLESAGAMGAGGSRTHVILEQDTTHFTRTGKLLAPFLSVAAGANAGRDLEKLKKLIEKSKQIRPAIFPRH